jgi:probable biosynthetic protein (TIGR04099 family)
MTIPLGILEIDRILGGGPASPAVVDSVVLGMPHLCLGGLSETWLLKECGHRHWFLLAHAAGRAVPDFRDASGAPVYAAFVAVTVRGAMFDAAHENDELAFDARLARTSRTRFISVHRLSVHGRAIGEVLLTSVFVKRTRPGSNRSIARVEVAGLPPAEPVGAFADHEAVVAALRHGRWVEHLGFARTDGATLDSLVIDPCPTQDFNGADFLYFSSFQAFVDRAECAFFRPANPRRTTRRRDIIYHGNVDAGERIAVVLRAVGHRDGTAGGGRDGLLGHWCRIERAADRTPLADVFTLRDDCGGP